VKREAAAELADAKRLESERKYYAARRAYQAVVRKHPDSAAAKYAQDRIVAFQSDQSIAAEIVKQEQRRKNGQDVDLGKNLLRLAKILIDQKKHDLARETLKRVIDNDPGSPEARQAVKELDKLPKPQDP
jgi:TolA-binding protein